jgi:hypothetical protein
VSSKQQQNNWSSRDSAQASSQFRGDSASIWRPQPLFDGLGRLGLSYYFATSEQPQEQFKSKKNKCSFIPTIFSWSQPHPNYRTAFATIGRPQRRPRQDNGLGKELGNGLSKSRPFFHELWLFLTTWRPQRRTRQMARPCHLHFMSFEQTKFDCCSRKIVRWGQIFVFKESSQLSVERIFFLLITPGPPLKSTLCTCMVCGALRGICKTWPQRPWPEPISGSA